VDAEDFCLMQGGPDGNSHGGIQSVVHGAVQEPVQKPFAGMADAEGPSQTPQLGNSPQEQQVVLGGLAEAHTRVEYDRCGGNPLTGEPVEALRQPVADLGKHIVIGRIELHGLWRSLDVHADHSRAVAGADLDHAGIERQTRDVVNNVGPQSQGFVGDLGLGGIDGNGNRDFRKQGLEHWQQSAELLGF
jgi:hypothetical protein